MENIKLNNGIEIPSVGLGTWLIDNDKVANVVCDAVSLGYRHIDTAQAYENEEGVGFGIKNCGVPREELFVTTKIRAEHKDYDSAKKSVLESLEKMGLDYLDLVIIHAPQPWVEFRETDNNYYKENVDVWRALEDLYNEGKVKAIGVSNFHDYDLKNILEIKFIDCLEHFIGKNINEYLTGMKTFKDVKLTKENNSKEYKENLEYYALHYRELVLQSNPRNEKGSEVTSIEI